MGLTKAIMATCTHCGEENAVLNTDDAAICSSCGKPFIVKNGVLIYEANHGTNQKKEADKETLKNFIPVENSFDNATLENKSKATGKKVGEFFLKKIKQMFIFLWMKYKEALKNDLKKTTFFTVFCILIVSLLIANRLNNDKDSDTKQVEVVATVVAPGTSEGYSGSNYEDVLCEFTNAGFTNIRAEGEEDLVLGIFNTDGDVDYVMVDGDYGYSTTTEYDPSVEVIIKYHSYPVEETEIDKYPFENVAKEDIELVKGTYIGSDACGLTIFEDGTCDFYAPSFPDIEEDYWTCNEEMLYIRSKGCGCTVQTDISSRDMSSFNLVSSSYAWTNETYVKVNDNPQHITEEDYKNLAKDVVFKSSLVLNKMNYEDAESTLKEAGFTNIETVGLNDMILGIFDTENQVESVSIEGTTYFTDYSVFDKTVQVTINYHCYPPADSETDKSTLEDTTEENNQSISSSNEDENNDDYEDYDNNSDYAKPMRALVVCITNYYADDNYIDGNNKDVNKFHSYDDLSGFYFKVLDYGQWREDDATGLYYVTGLKLQPYNTSCELTVYSATIKSNDENEEYTISALSGYLGEVSISDIEEDDASGIWGAKFLTVPYSLIEDDRTEAIPGVEEKTLSYDDAYDTFYSYCLQYFNKFEKDDLSQCYEMHNSDGSYFFKWDCKAKNAYGQKIKFTVEGTVYGNDINDTVVKNFMYY